MTTPSKSKQMVNQLKYSIHQEIPIRNTKETITSKMVVLAINLIPSTLKIISNIRIIQIIKLRMGKI